MSYIVGIDEVGRGPWAGPLVVGAVVLGEAHIEGLTDSKKLSKAKREALARRIVDEAAGYGLGWVDAEELDRIGLSESLATATRRALEQITVPYHEIIIDGTVNFLSGTGKGPYVTVLKKADLLIGAVSAASIIAKVARDDYMAALAERYGGYGFERHVGYGTAAHRKAVESLGVTPEHRRSFAPIAALTGVSGTPHRTIDGTNKQMGNDAETATCEWLSDGGFDVVERNWKTRFCEIDIVAKKDDRFYFIEVKHRKGTGQGGGLAAITPRKLRQMRFAASLYLTRHSDADACLAVVTTTDSSGIVVEGLLTVE